MIRIFVNITYVKHMLQTVPQKLPRSGHSLP